MFLLAIFVAPNTAPLFFAFFYQNAKLLIIDHELTAFLEKLLTLLHYFVARLYLNKVIPAVAFWLLRQVIANVQVQPLILAYNVA